jgi:hypothetical protein
VAEAKSGEAKAQQLLREALQELDAIKEGKRLPENTSPAFAESHSERLPGNH